MDPPGVFCPNLACPVRGQADHGNIRVHSQQTRRYRCTVCGQTFTASKGTAFYRLHRSAPLFVQVVTLLAYGCPPAAIVAAFGLDERTVAAWHQRAGTHSERIQQGLVEPPTCLRTCKPTSCASRSKIDILSACTGGSVVTPVAIGVPSWNEERTQLRRDTRPYSSQVPQ